MLHKGNNHSDVFMAQSLDDTLLWETAQWEANKLLQLDEPENARSRRVIDTQWCGTDACFGGVEQKNKKNNLILNKIQVVKIAAATLTKVARLGGGGHSKSASPCMISTGARRWLLIWAQQAGVGNVWHELGSTGTTGAIFLFYFFLNTVSSRVVYYTGQTGHETKWRGNQDGSTTANRGRLKL